MIYVSAILGSSGDSRAFGFALLLGLFVTFYRSWRAWRRGVRLKDTPNVPPSVVPMGRAESTGVARPPAGVAQIGRLPSVYYAFQVDRWEKRGKNSSWVTKAEGNSDSDFFLTDDVGFIGVRTAGAVIDVPFEEVDEASQLSLSQLEALAQTSADTSGFDRHGDRHSPIASLPGSWRVCEKRIPTDATVTVAGPVLQSPDPAVGEFRADPSQKGGRGELYIAVGDEGSVQKRNSFRLLPLLGSAVASGPCAVFAVLLLVDSGGAPGTAALSVLGFGLSTALLVPVIWRLVLDQFNRTVVLANQVESCWSMLDVALSRRASLIPRLEAVLGASYAHERVVQEGFAAARWASTRRATADQAHTSAVASTEIAPSLLALSEAYPELRTNTAAAKMHEELVRSENLIQGARETYNEAVQLFLTRLGQFPSSLFAGSFKNRKQEYWSA